MRIWGLGESTLGYQGPFTPSRYPENVLLLLFMIKVKSKVKGIVVISISH